MSSCKKIDALMVDWLYDELDPAAKAQFKQHVDDCATCRDELASLSRIREMFSDLPAMEPPAAGQAILMHEAAKRAPATRRHDEQSLWARLMDLFRPVLAHPALAAAASLVLVVTVAGSLYLRGKSQIASPVVPQSAAPLQAEGAWPPPAGQEQDVRDSIDKLAGDEAGNEEDPADFKSITVDRPERELTLKDLPESKSFANRDAPARTSKKAPRVQQKKRSSYATAKRESPRPNSVRTEGLLLDNDDSFAAPPPADNKLSAQSPGAVAAGESAATTSSSVSGVRGGGVEAEKIARRRAVTPEPKTPAAPRKSKSRKPSPAVGPYEPAQTSAPVIRSVPRAGRAGQTSAKAELAWAQAQHKKLDKSARSKRCGDAARIAVDIMDRNPGYYYRFVQGSKDFKRCQQYVAAEQRRRAARKARSKAAQSDEAAGAAAEAAE